MLSAQPSLVFVVPVFACNTRMHFSHVSHVLLISCGRAVIVLGGSVARRARRNRRRRAAASASRAEIVQRPLRVVHVLARIEHCTKQSRCELFPKMALEQSEWRKCALHGLSRWSASGSSSMPDVTVRRAAAWPATSARAASPMFTASALCRTSLTRTLTWPERAAHCRAISITCTKARRDEPSCYAASTSHNKKRRRCKYK